MNRGFLQQDALTEIKLAATGRINLSMEGLRVYRDLFADEGFGQ